MNRYCFLILITLGVFACDTQLTPYMEQLTQWDKALENNPETIGDSLATLNVAKLNKTEKAYYYLLEAAVADKNLKQLKNDSTLLISERYYNSKKDYYALARTQYYLSKYQEDPQKIYELLKTAEINFEKSPKNDYHILGLIYYWLGQIQYKQINLSEAELYYKKSSELYSQLKDSLYMAYSLRQLSRIYIRQKREKLAKEKLAEVLEILNHIDNEQDEQLSQLYASILNNQSLLFQKIGDLDSAFLISKKCISIIEKRNITIKSSFYMVFVKILRMKGEIDSCKIYGLKTKEAAEKENNLFNLVSCYKILSQIEEEQGNYKNACNFHLKYNELKDKLNSNHEKEILKELEQKYVLAEKEKEHLRDRNRSLWYFTISLTIALTASIVALYFSWIHRKLKVKNAHLSEEIAKTQWGFALSKELIADNSSAYEKLELLLTKNIKLIPDKVYYEFENSLKAQKEEYSQRLFSALTNIDNNFIEKLQHKFPDLNIDEVMLAYMLRHEWDINDIAQVFRITFEAFKKRKYRLKIKILGVDNNKINLEDYLSKM